MILVLAWSLCFLTHSWTMMENNQTYFKNLAMLSLHWPLFIILHESDKSFLLHSFTFSRRCFVKKIFLKISEYSQGTCVWVLRFNKISGHQTCVFIKKSIQHKCFLENVAKLLRASILKNICDQLLLFKGCWGMTTRTSFVIHMRRYRTF